MKRILLLILFVLPFTTSAQSILATTKDGREVLLKADNTWQFLGTSTDDKKTSANKNCELPVDFKEPEGDKKIQNWLKRGDAQVKDLKKHVAVDNNCEPEDITLMKISEQKGNGNYILCVNGETMQYKRIGTVFMKAGESPF